MKIHAVRILVKMEDNVIRAEITDLTPVSVRITFMEETARWTRVRNLFFIFLKP